MAKKIMMVAAIAALAFGTPLAAQQRSSANLADLTSAVVAKPEGSRAMVTSVLMSRRGLAAAAGVGLTPEALAARITSLDDASAKSVADGMLAGGEGTVVISTTAIIVALLLIILLTR